MNRLHLLMVCLFVVALGTGVVVGVGMTRHPEPHEGGRSFLGEELSLTPDQSEKMKAIWSDVLHGSGQAHADQRRKYSKERDDALMALLTPEQKTAYDKILAHYNDELNVWNKQRDTEFQQATEKTKEILNDRQRKMYDDLLKKGFRGGPWGPRDGRPDGNRPGNRGQNRGPETMPDATTEKTPV